MQSWISSNSSWLTPVIAALAVVLTGIKLWMDIRASAAISKDIAALKQKFVYRNWLGLLLVAGGTVAMLSVLVVPLSQVSVLVAVLGCAFCSMGLAAVLVMEAVVMLAARLGKYTCCPPNSA